MSYLSTSGINIYLNYGNVGGLTAAGTLVDFSPTFSKGGVGSIIRGVSVSDTIGSKFLLAIVSAAGEIIAYEGSYPASSDWSSVGRFRIPRPMFVNSAIDYRGDTLIVTEGGLISLRDVFLKGSQTAIDQAISTPIINRWRQIMRAVSALTTAQKGFITGLYDTSNNRIVIQIPVYVDFDGTTSDKPFWLIYDIGRGAWYEHVANVAYYATGMCKFGDYIYYATSHGNEVFKKEGRSDYKDAQTDGSTTSGYAFKIKSAPLPLSRSGVNKVDGLEYITKGDYYADTTVTFTADLGRATSGATTFPTLPFTTLQKQFISAGVEGTYVQWELSNSGARTNSTYGCEIYGVNALYEQGGLR
jgi:hypothetical protein